MSRASRRAEKFGQSDVSPITLARQDMEYLGVLPPGRSSVKLRLRWINPPWARQGRYLVHDLACGGQLIVRPATPGKVVEMWEVLHNGIRQEWIRGTIEDACLYLEQRFGPLPAEEQALPRDACV